MEDYMNLETTAGNFIKIYELAEKYSRHSSLQIWIGLTDTEEDGQFKYISDGGFPLISFPWAVSQPNGGRDENCLTAFIPEDQQNQAIPKWFDRPCVENDGDISGAGEAGHM